MAVIIDITKCCGCGLCIEVCLDKATYNKNGKTYVDQSKCTLCGNCEGMCIGSALTFERPVEVNSNLKSKRLKP